MQIYFIFDKSNNYNSFFTFWFYIKQYFIILVLINLKIQKIDILKKSDLKGYII